jgi:hypothetical protein
MLGCYVNVNKSNSIYAAQNILLRDALNRFNFCRGTGFGSRVSLNRAALRGSS